MVRIMLILIYFNTNFILKIISNNPSQKLRSETETCFYLSRLIVTTNCIITGSFKHVHRAH